MKSVSKKRAAYPLGLYRTIDGESSDSYCRDRVAGKLFFQPRGQVLEIDLSHTHSVVAKDSVSLAFLKGENRYSDVLLEILPSVFLEVFIEAVYTAVEVLAIDISTDFLEGKVH